MAEAHPNRVVPLVLGEVHAEIETCLQNSNGPALRALTIRLVHRHGLGIWNELRRQPHWCDALPWWEQQLDLQDWATPSPASGPVPTATPAPAPATPEAAQDPEAVQDEAVEAVGAVAPAAMVAELLSRLESTTSERTVPALEEPAAGLLRNLQVLPNEQKAPAETEQLLVAGWGEATPTEGNTPAAARDDTPTEGNTATDDPQPAASPRHLRDWLPQTLLPHQWPAAS